MKILLVTGSAAYGGTEKQVIHLAKYLSLRGMDVTIAFLFHLGPLVENLKGTSVQIYSCNFNKRNLLKNLKSFVNLTFFLKKQRYDVINAFLPHAIVLSWLANKFTSKKTPLISGVRGSYFSTGYLTQYLFIPLYKYVLIHSNFIICNSNSGVTDLKLKYKFEDDRITCIPNGVERTIMNSKKESTTSNVIVVSNFHIYKGYDLLFEAIKTITCPITFNFVGDGDEFNNFRNLEKSSNLNMSKIVFHGAINPVQILKKSDFAIHPSRTEGLSNAIMEELSSGLPVIAFDVGGNNELITHGYNGFLIQPFDTRALAVAITNMALDKDLKKKMQSNATISMKTFTFEKLAEKYLHIYYNLHSQQ